MNSTKPNPAIQTNLPLRAGLGLKSEHFQDILENQPDIGFFEIHAENYMVAGGPFHHYLTKIREKYPLSIHGVALSIGGEGNLDQEHLKALKNLLDCYQPESFSEHLAWSTHSDTYLNDLLPLPYTSSTLNHVCDHIDQTQSYLRRRMLLENPATYVEFSTSTISETDFICEIIKRTGCGLLLDVNNVYISSVNHHRDPEATIRALPLPHVGEIHLAGFYEQTDAAGDRLLIDSHGSPVAKAVWDLYQLTLKLTGPVATLLERDNDVPPFSVLMQEASFAENYLTTAFI